MKKEPNKKMIGLFLVIGFVLFLGLIGQSVFHKIHTDTEDMVVMYFSESLQGLSEGSPIIFQGVEVGKVTRIVLVADKNSLKFNVAVYARLKEIDIISEGSLWEKLWRKKQEDFNFLEIMIEQGMRARLASQSYLTGQLRIDLVMLPETEIRMFESPKKENFPQIPTVLSAREELARGFNALQLHKTVERINNVAEVLGKELPILLPALTQSSQNLDKTLERVAGSSEETLASFNETLHEVSDAAKSFQNLADYLEQHPESLIQGKKGE